MVRLKKENQYLGKAERKTYFMQKTKKQNPWNILFSGCCLRMSQEHYTSSHTDSFHCVPFSVGVRADIGHWWLDNLAP